MVIDSGPRTAPGPRPRGFPSLALQSLARAARAARAYPRRNPMTFAYLLIIVAGLLLLTQVLSGPAADHLKIAISTNPHNMAHKPLTVMLASPLFAATDSGLPSHLLTIAGGVGICMAALERRLGAARTAALFLIANTVATAVATSIAAAAVHSGRYPAQWWDGYDYGISYGVLAIAAAVTPLVPLLPVPSVPPLPPLPLMPRAARLLWVAGVFAYPFVSAQWFGLVPNFATIGHETAAVFGLVAGYFLLRGGAYES